MGARMANGNGRTVLGTQVDDVAHQEHGNDDARQESQVVRRQQWKKREESEGDVERNDRFAETGIMKSSIAVFQSDNRFSRVGGGDRVSESKWLRFGRV
jgi:hypothetical protein